MFYPASNAVSGDGLCEGMNEMAKMTKEFIKSQRRWVFQHFQILHVIKLLPNLTKWPDRQVFQTIFALTDSSYLKWY